MQYEIAMTITYNYDHPAVGGRHVLHLTPRQIDQIQEVEQSIVKVSPQPDEWEKHSDFFENTQIDIAFNQPHKTISFNVVSKITRFPIEPPTDTSPPLTDMKAEIKNIRTLGADSPHHFIGPSPRIKATHAVQDYASQLTANSQSTFEAVKTINHALYKDLKFDPSATNVDTPYELAFKNRHGVCQDFSHIMIACLRSLNIPAAYVSGYLRTNPPEGQDRLEGADAMHAWVRVWLGSRMGWLEFDPTNNLIVSEDHIVIGYGRDYSEISPIKGVLRSEGSQFSTQSVDVRPVSVK
ncbi:transglutaminase family protein [Hirschia litorea]|uniref:Transglutaminase domain-containing protein n=1 Tax=Hirschia litorea TaxID=1199156 RepID=A0ABW2IHU3_9PROT